ncbi:hypothetical protein CEXT_462281 [Caerostris extrusa]|uniref:Uncharacterized protein n=1 Tax=Caerostris extrusa TaxID=172846 RepID=A0AAV4RUV8_CAEEX|nr:hypothetical protein CEXT_462281 [Caerostris extrusa]
MSMSSYYVYVFLLVCEAFDTECFSQNDHLTNVRIQQLSIPVCTKSYYAIVGGTNPVTRNLEIAHKKLALWRHYSTLNDTSRKHIMDLLMIQLYGGESVDASVDKDPFSDMHC